MDKDITNQCSFGEIDDECLPLRKCVCGEEYDHWHFVLSIYREGASICKKCGRKLYFRNKITIYEIIED